MNRTCVFTALAVAAVASALVMNAINGFSSKTSLEGELAPDRGSYADRHVERALHLLEHGTLGDEEEPFLGGFARGPVEAGTIALAFLLFGKSMWSLWVFQMIVFVFVVWLTYVVSKSFLDGAWALLPALATALFWGISLYVFNVNNEIVSLFFMLGFTYALLRYREGGRAWLLLVAGISLGFLVLAKPIFEYFLPLAVGLFLWQMWHERGWRVSLRHAGVFAAALFLVVGGWHTRNYAVLGTPRISAGGHSLLIHAESALYPRDTSVGFLIASVAGDLVVDVIVPGYAAENEPRETIREVFNRRRPALRASGLSEFETDDIFFKEALAIIREHPLRYLSTTPAWFLRMNSPPRYNGGMMERFLVDTALSFVQRIGINLILRIPWLIFIAIVFLMTFRILATVRHGVPSLLAWLAAIVLYTNAAYAFLAHAEVRYIVVVMPFYFLFAVMWLRHYFAHEN